MSEVTEFASYLASLTDPAARERAIRQAKMQAVKDAPEEAFKAPIRSMEDYLASEIEIPPVLVHPFMCVRGGLNMTIGRAGKGKTVLNLNRMIRWSAGLPWFDDWKDRDGNRFLLPEKPLKVLIVENEGAAAMFHRQIGMML